jgi:hypothetical protein
MTDKTDPAYPINVAFPKYLDYDNALNYRQPKPTIRCSETPDNEDKLKSGEIHLLMSHPF